MSLTDSLPNNQVPFVPGVAVFDVADPDVHGVIYGAGPEQSEVKFEGERTPRIVLTKYLRVVGAEAEVDGAASGDKDSSTTNPAAPESPAFNWRAHLRVHPAAELFPSMSESDPAALKELAENIKVNGLIEPLVGWASSEGQFLLDGRNRLDALALLGLLHETADHHLGVKKWTGKQWSNKPGDRIEGREFFQHFHDGDGDPYAIALFLNNAEQKRETLPSDPAVEAVETGTEIAETAAPPSNTRSKEDFAELINTSWRKGAATVIETSRLIFEAKEQLDPDVFKSLLKRHLDCGDSVGRKLLCIATNRIICAHGHKLPPCWTTIYELTKVEDDVLEAALADGRIHPGMERKDGSALRHNDGGGDNEGEDGGAEGEDGGAETEADSPFEILVAAWNAASESDRRALFDQLGREGLVVSMSPELLADLRDYILGQLIATASKSSKFAVNSTDLLHVMLRCAEQEDLSDEDKGKMIGAGRAILRDAKRRRIAWSDIVIAEGNPKLRKK